MTGPWATSVLWDQVDALLGVLWQVVSTGLIHGTALALVTALLAATVLRRARPALMAALWTIVLLKFLIPIGPELPVSLSGLLDAVLAPAAGPAHGEVVASPAVMPAAARSTAELLWLGGQLLLWLAYAGLVLTMLIRRVRGQGRVRRWADGLPVAGPLVRDIAAEAGARLGLARLPDMRISIAAAGPQVIGLWRPVVVVPGWLAGAELRAALLHELAHLRRRDTWVRSVQILAGTVFWFWPVVRWANRRIDAHREMACDQWAVSCGPLGAAAYARMLLSFARRAASGQAAAGGRTAAMSVGLMGERSQIENRVHSLLAGASRPGLGLVTGTVVMVWALLSLGTTRGAQAQEVAPECEIAPDLLARLLTHYPEADMDGDGVLTREEACAHQRRLQRLVGTDADATGAGADDADDARWPEPAASSRAGAGAPAGAISAMEVAAFNDLWSSSGLSDCAACECGEVRELRDTGSALVSMERNSCSNRGEQQ